MKISRFIVFVLAGLLGAGRTHGQEDFDPDLWQTRAAPQQFPYFVDVPDLPGLPRVLLIGDSISMEYTLGVRARLQGVANVHRPAENCEATEHGLDRLDAWLGTGHWDVIHFNFGAWDLVEVNRGQGILRTPLPLYEKNLQEIVRRLKATGAKLIFATITPMPPDIRGRKAADVPRYNQVAERVMKENGVTIDDLYAFVLPMEMQIQLPHDPHFLDVGRFRLADTVAASILAQLPGSSRLPPPPVTPAKWAGRPVHCPSADMELEWIPAGAFRMGSATGGYPDEHPVTAVRISRGFWLGRFEVTQKQWRAVMGGEGDYFTEANQAVAVDNVSWNDAEEFCRRLTAMEQAAGRLPSGYEYRLPTEAEWEYACRAGSADDYGGDGKNGDLAWYSGNSHGAITHVVGQKRANPWGLYDMLGNVWELCSDWYGPYSGHETFDPAGPRFGSLRVMRGGCWANLPQVCRSAARGWIGLTDRFVFVGFRVALAPEIDRRAKEKNDE